MTAAFLQLELSNIINDSKKKFIEVRRAAEISLNELKAITVTSESQLAGDLSRKSSFIDPFILACQSKNAKLIGSSAACLQRLIASHAVPRQRLSDSVDALRDVSNTAYEVQLRILQTLPALLQLYESEVHGELLARVLGLSVLLLSSKTALVSNTATATFQQLVSAVFERTSSAKTKSPLSDSGSDDGHRKDQTESAAFDDAAQIFQDFCHLLNQNSPTFLKVTGLSRLTLLQLLEAILNSHHQLVKDRPLLLQVSQAQLIPGLLQVLTGKDEFAPTVCALKVTVSLVQFFSTELHSDLQQVLAYLVTAIDRDVSPLWKRALCLEVFRCLCNDFALLRQTYTIFDEQHDSLKLVSRFMAAMVRLSAEDPVLIGLGRQSTIPIRMAATTTDGGMASVETQGLGGNLASVDSADANSTGISNDWSVLDLCLLDMDNVSRHPTIPSTYLYALSLDCISSFCDGLSKFIMPYSVSHRRETQSSVSDDLAADQEGNDLEESGVRSRQSTNASHKYSRLINPLSLPNHSSIAQIQTCAKMIESCWPAILATCSTFLNAALDTHFYHQLIRSVQKLAQVSGILALSTPRDALLTSLAKSSVPPTSIGIAGFNAAQASSKTAAQDTPHNVLTDLMSPTRETPSSVLDNTNQILNFRHLLCLRALLNLGIALGPTLDQGAWLVVLETLQQVEAIMSKSATVRPASRSAGGQDTQGNLGNEMVAVNTAMKRMFDSTRSYSDDAFVSILHALFKLIGEVDAERYESGSVLSPLPLASPVIERPARRGSRKASGLWVKTRSLDVETRFVLAKAGELARINLMRFADVKSVSSTWNFILPILLRLMADFNLPEELRLRSSSLIDLIAMETMKLLNAIAQSANDIDLLQCTCLNALKAQISAQPLESLNPKSATELEMQKRVLEALEDILGYGGDSLKDGWRIVFEILSMSLHSTSVDSLNQVLEYDDQGQTITNTNLNSKDIVAFRCVQLIVSDFLHIIDGQSLIRLTSLMPNFGAQQSDVNVALTTTTLLRSITSLIHERVDKIELLNIEASVSTRSTGTSAETLDLQIWSAAVRQLILMCQDDRQDIRDATTRVFLQILEAASDRFSARTWQVMLLEGPMAILQQYRTIAAGQTSDVILYKSASTQILSGIVDLMTRNITTIASDGDFSSTWELWNKTNQSLAADKSLDLSELAYSSLAKVVSAFAVLDRPNKDWIKSALDIWAQDVDTKKTSNLQPATPNQASLHAHGQVLVEAWKISRESVQSFQHNSHRMSSYIMISIKTTIFTAVHPPYTSDVKKLSMEQEVAAEMLAILKELLSEEIAAYTEYILELLRTILDLQNDGKSAMQTRSNKIQQPTLIAFASHCIDKLSEFVGQCQHDLEYNFKVKTTQSLAILSVTIQTKYANIHTNPEAPLWRNATATATKMIEFTQLHFSEWPTIGQKDADQIARRIFQTIQGIMWPGDLESANKPPADELLLKDEEFDIEHLRQCHNSARIILTSLTLVDTIYKEYALGLFNASLIAKPWFFDFPDDLLNEPLKDFNKVRLGSVHNPVFHRRQKICYAALDILFDLVRDRSSPDQQQQQQQNKTDKSSGHINSLSHAAVPYLLLRVAHPLKTFLADQILRSLSPHPMPQQVEIKTVLTKCLEMRCDDEVVANALGRSAAIGGKADGRSHLRVLYPLILRFQRYWNELPRLKGDMAWQAGYPGREIEAALNEWVDVVGQDWGI